MVKRLRQTFIILLVMIVLFSGTGITAPSDISSESDVKTVIANGVSLSDIPTWSGEASVEINGNNPSFSSKQKKQTKDYVKYSDLDENDRPGVAIGCLGTKTLNDDERVPISSIKPVGWHTKKYPKIIEDRYVYNRCHLLMQAAAAGIKEGDCNSYKNLITGTRYLNVDGMLPYETVVHNYIERTGNHVMYRVTPIYKGKELVARGVQMEAYSVEDDGKGVCFNVYCYNIQPGIHINYKTGNTKKKIDPTQEMALALSYGAATVATSGTSADADLPSDSYVDTTSTNGINDNSTASDAQDYILNKNTKRIHYPWCHSVTQMKEKNKWPGLFSRSELIDAGYVPCGQCKP